MKILTRIIILATGFLFLGFDILLYRSFEVQKAVVVSVKNKEDVESEFNTNKFKYQAEQIERLSQDLKAAREQIKGQNDSIASQNDTLVQEVQKRQAIEDQDKNIQISLIDIKAEADAIKQDMKNWQKDYVAVLAELEKKMDDSKDQVQIIQNKIADLRTYIENQNHPVDNSLSNSSMPAQATANPAPDTANSAMPPVTDNGTIDNSQR